MNTRSRGWTFTVNNYSEEDLVRLDEVSELTTYLCFGKEVAPTTNTKHLQGYVYFDNAKSFSKLQKILPKGTHLEVSKGTAQENKVYCSKEGDFKEYGTIPAQGKRNDINIIKDEIIAGGSMEKIIEIASNYQSLKTAEMLLKYKEPKRNWKPEVVWYFGESGLGKTRTVYDVAPNVYRKSNATGKWWEGYDAHSDVLIDDVKDNSTYNYSILLELLDRYETRVETKGGTRQFLAKRIYITSILHPRDLFSSQHAEAAELLRRIDNIIELITPSPAGNEASITPNA